MQPLYDLNLQQLEDVHVVGNWRVVSRRVSQLDPASALIEADKLRFEAPDRVVVLQGPADAATTSSAPSTGDEGIVVSTTAAQEVGHWRLQRDPLLSRPYLKLWLPNGETRALITRMRRSRDGAECEMMLYFQTGTEVQLQCA